MRRRKGHVENKQVGEKKKTATKEDKEAEWLEAVVGMKTMNADDLMKAIAKAWSRDEAGSIYEQLCINCRADVLPWYVEEWCPDNGAAIDRGKDKERALRTGVKQRSLPLIHWVFSDALRTGRRVHVKAIINDVMDIVMAVRLSGLKDNPFVFAEALLENLIVPGVGMQPDSESCFFDLLRLGIGNEIFELIDYLVVYADRAGVPLYPMKIFSELFVSAPVSVRDRSLMHAVLFPLAKLALWAAISEEKRIPWADQVAYFSAGQPRSGLQVLAQAASKFGDLELLHATVEYARMSATMNELSNYMCQYPTWLSKTVDTRVYVMYHATIYLRENFQIYRRMPNDLVMSHFANKDEPLRSWHWDIVRDFMDVAKRFGKFEFLAEDMIKDAFHGPRDANFRAAWLFYLSNNPSPDHVIKVLEKLCFDATRRHNWPMSAVRWVLASSRVPDGIKARLWDWERALDHGDIHVIQAVPVTAWLRLHATLDEALASVVDLHLLSVFSREYVHVKAAREWMCDNGFGHRDKNGAPATFAFDPANIYRHNVVPYYEDLHRAIRHML
jgi:hypothetical protein